MFSQKQIEEMIQEGQKSPKFVKVFETILDLDEDETSIEISISNYSSDKLYKILIDEGETFGGIGNNFVIGYSSGDSETYIMNLEEDSLSWISEESFYAHSDTKVEIYELQ